MKVVVTAEGTDLEAATSPLFGRCPVFVLVDSETLEYQVIANPALSLGGGAGVQAAQMVVQHGAEAVLSQNVGPNAFQVLEAGGVKVYRVGAGTVRQAVLNFLAGKLELLPVASTGAHSGMG
ncbi:MAG: NifB/NifX family molybdenum-iron cluster-binding protein [Anaerolineae bacterium]